jgi:hypothetical protein
MEANRRGRQLALAGAIAALAALAAGSPAYGKGCLKNGGPSSVQQYVEQLPQACGSSATGTGQKQRKLPASIERKIQQQGGKQAQLLENIATSEQYGAPQQKIKVHKAKARLTRTQRKILTDSEARQSNALGASLGVVTDGSDSRLLALVILMVGITIFVLVTAVRRHRVRR